MGNHCTTFYVETDSKSCTYVQCFLLKRSFCQSGHILFNWWKVHDPLSRNHCILIWIGFNINCNTMFRHFVLINKLEKFNLLWEWLYYWNLPKSDLTGGHSLNRGFTVVGGEVWVKTVWTTPLARKMSVLSICRVITYHITPNFTRFLLLFLGSTFVLAEVVAAAVVVVALELKRCWTRKRVFSVRRR